MRVVITGAGGFIGRRLAAQLISEEPALTRLTLLDAKLPQLAQDSRVRHVEGDLRNANVRAAALEDGVDVVFHLAAVPGGAAEANYALSRAVNVDATLDLFEETARAGNRPRMIFASTIAVFGAPLPDHIDDDTPTQPAMIYGAHKLMMEMALADFSRRGELDGVALRLPGIVPRPPAPSGMKAAFMSEIFHALEARLPFTSPVSPQGTMWLMSVSRVAMNLRHAAKLQHGILPPHRALTLPALRVDMATLAAAIAAETGADLDSVSYAPELALELQFGRLPPLATPSADRLEFRHDGDVKSLIRQAFADGKWQ